MTEFKKGDRVVVINDKGEHFYSKGAEGIVVKVSFNGDTLIVNFDKGNYNHTCKEWMVNPKNVQKVNEAQMKLTKIKTLEETYKIWKELAETGASSKPDWATKYVNKCPLCEYTIQEGSSISKDNCKKYCLLYDLWPDFYMRCETIGSTYRNWCNSYNQIKRAEYAQIIADAAKKRLDEELEADKEIRVGDFVKIVDGSGAVKVSEYEPYTSIGLCKDVFEVLQTDVCLDFLQYNDGLKAHNIFIKNTRTGEIYLHSKAFVRKVQKPKEKKVFVKSLNNIMKVLLEDGYKPSKDGAWRKVKNKTFAHDMFNYCGKEPSVQWSWKPEWLEEKEV